MTLEQLVTRIITLGDEKSAGYEMKIENAISQYHQDLMSKERKRVVQVIKDELKNAPIEVQMTKGVIFAKIIARIEHECCDGECNHDDCCGKVAENCPNY